MTSLADGSNTAGQPAICVRDLVRRFGQMQALGGLNLDAMPGRITGLIGNNGAGKTTTIHTLMGFIPPHGGALSVLGRDPQRKAVAIRERVGFFPERDQPYDWMSLRVLFQMGAAAYDRWDRAWCEALCAQFDLPARRQIKDLSKGMVAKAKLVFAFAHHPECLILDEPTSGLDPGSRHEVLTMLRYLTENHGVTTLFSSHDLNDVSGLAHDLVIIHQGRALFASAMDTLRDDVALIEVPEWTLDVPATLAGLVIKSVRREGSSLWLVRDRSSRALREFRQQYGPDRVLEHQLSLTELFLFLTSGWAEPGRRSARGT